LKRFWDFPAYCKYAELQEGRHNYLLSEALHDSDTGVTEYQRNEFILYDKEGTEALLYRPKSVVGRVGMRLYRAVVDLTSNNQTPQ